MSPPPTPSLDPVGLERYWRFVAERQRVWVRRVVRREDPPGTADPALRAHRFTNVYRRLDPGTQYAILEILARDARAADRLFNLLVYRLIGRAAWWVELQDVPEDISWVKFPNDHVYHLPLGCMVPEGAENIVATGRCVDAEVEALPPSG